MELEDARHIAREALVPGTMINDKMLVRAFDTLSEAGDTQDQRLADRIEREFPLLIENIDADGNWIGPVPNENGWTP